MKGVLILLVTAIVVCVGNRTQGVHRHRHGKTGHKPERDTGSITLKPGTAKNKLFPEYGTNFRYIGEVKNGLDRVTVVTSIPIPKYSDIELRPIVFNNCTKDLWRQGARTRGQPQYETYNKCNRILAQAKFYKSQQEELQFFLRQLLTHDLYSVLPELNQTPSMYNHGPSYNIRPVELSDPYGTKFSAKTVNHTAQIRSRRGFGSILAKAIPGLITLAVESVSSYIKGRQQQRINTAVEELRSDDNKIKNDLKQYRNELLMYGRYNLKSLRGIINTINALHKKQNYFEWAVKQKDFNFRKSDMDAVNYNFDTMMYMKNVREEHVVTYREAVKAARDFLDGIAIVTQGRLPRALISDNQLREILGKVDAMVKRNYPDYVLAAKHISHYRDMKMVTFSVDQQAHSLILTFPAFIKNYKQPPLSLYEVETVPVPIIDKNVKADSYSQVRIEKSYIAAGTDYYIQLRISELWMCKSIRHIYYCEEIIDKFPSVVDKLKTNAYPAEPNKIKMGTKSLGKGKSSKVNSNTTASQSNCSSIHPLHSIRENGEESDMEEQVPELVDISDNEISSTKDNNRDNGQGPTTENENERNENEDERNENEKNKNENSRHTHRPIILMTNLKHLLEK